MKIFNTTMFFLSAILCGFAVVLTLFAMIDEEIFFVLVGIGCIFSWGYNTIAFNDMDRYILGKQLNRYQVIPYTIVDEL